MGVRIGHASISETGKVNGVKGDSTGKEVCVRSWYDKPWDFMAIHPDEEVREKHAAACEAGCANNYIGYGQSDRNTLNTEAKKVNYDLSKIITNCNTDCSEFMNVCAVASGAPGVTHASNGWTTRTMKAELQKAGYKIITDKTYLESSAYCVRGAIYVKVGSHTVCGLDNGTNAERTLSKAGLTGSGSNNSAYSGKVIGTAVAKCGMFVRTGPSTSSVSCGLISKGKTVEVIEALSSGWYKIKYAGADGGYAYTSNRGGKYYDFTPNNKPVYEIGKTYTTLVEVNVRQKPETSSAKVGHAGLTTNAKANDKDKDGAIDKGTKVTVKDVSYIGDDIWVKIPSGWIAAYYKGETYVG